MKWVGDNNRDSTAGNCMVENIFEELDTINEWYYNKTTGNLYYWPPTGTNLSIATVEVACIDQLIKVIGTSATTPVSYLNFNNLTFTHSHRTLFTTPFDKLLLGDWAIARSGTVLLQNTENVSVKNCYFNQVGGNGVFVNAYNKNDTIYNNRFMYAGASCVAIVGLKTAAKTVSSWIPYNMVTTIADQTVGPKTEDYPRNISVSNNYMYYLGRFEKQTSGVCLSMCRNVSVQHNTITGSPRSGINVNDGSWGGHDIGYNDISYTVQESGDHGPFNSWGRDRFWTYLGYNTQGSNGTAKFPFALLDAMTPILLHNNRVKDNNGSGGYGIDLDDGSTNYWIYNNLTLTCGIKLREGFYRKVYNNIIITNQLHLHVWYASCRDTILRNIVINASPYEFIGISLASNQALLDYNLFWNNGSAVSYTPSTGQETHSKINVDPMFTNAAAGDYTLKAGSPALAMGFVNIPMDSFGRMTVPADIGCPTGIEHSSVQTSGKTSLQCLVKGTKIISRYWLNKNSRVSLTLFSLNGKKIAEMPEREETAGAHELSWKSEQGVMSSRFYLLAFSVDGRKEVQKIVLLK
jgi:hypothetical protein